MANKVREYQGPQWKDHNMTPLFWHNKDKGQKHYFRSVLERETGCPENKGFETLTCNPGKVLQLPHRYYEIYTRDGTKAKGARVIGEFVRDAAPSSLTKGD